MSRPLHLTTADVHAAQHRLRNRLPITPCPDSAALSQLTACTLFCKLDNLMPTGSFKERGARNALELLPDSERSRGVIAASAGNHALALAYHGCQMGIPVTVVVPAVAPLIKVERCRSQGAHVLIHGTTIEEARSHALELAQEQSLAYINGYDDPRVIAGQGTMALEIAAQVPDLDALLVPVGGGGLLAGTVLALRDRHPNLQLWGIESEATASFTHALGIGKPTTFVCQPTLADGLAVPQVGANALAIIRDRIDGMVTVSEQSVAVAILHLLEMEKTVVEGAAAVTLAALLDGKLPQLAGRRVALALCGGNIDPNRLGRVIDIALAADGRVTRFAVNISDRPGGLTELTRALAESGVSVKQIHHDRTFSGPNLFRVNCHCVVETRGHHHATTMMDLLRERGFTPVAQPILR